MKHLNKIIGLLAISVLFFQSCSLGDDDLKHSGPYYMGWATVDKSNTGSSDPLLILDNGATLEIEEYWNYEAEGIKTLSDQTRAYIYFFRVQSEQTEAGKYPILLSAYEEILTKKPTYNSETDEETVGYDPINVDNWWFGDGFLNIDFHFYAYNGSIRHLISLYVIEDHPLADENNIYVELRHNANGDQAYNTALGRVAFDINEFLPEDQASIMVHFSYINYQNVQKSSQKSYYREESNELPL